MEIRKGKRYLQQYQVDYIKENAAGLTAAQISGAVGCSQATLSTWFKKLKVKPTKSVFQSKPPVIPACEPYKIEP